MVFMVGIQYCLNQFEVMLFNVSISLVQCSAVYFL